MEILLNQNVFQYVVFDGSTYTTKSEDQVSNSLNLRSRSKNHEVKPSSEGYALDDQTGGTLKTLKS